MKHSSIKFAFPAAAGAVVLAAMVLIPMRLASDNKTGLPHPQAQPAPVTSGTVLPSMTRPPKASPGRKHTAGTRSAAAKASSGASGGNTGSSLPPATGGDSLVPASGAYLGAYVDPTVYTQQATIGAVQTFERQVGRPLDLVHVYHPWLSPFPNAADKYFVDQGKVLLLTWGGDADTTQIIAGKYDSLIRQRAEAVKALRRPIMMEYRHEMDRPNLQWMIHSPADYIAAWDHIRSIFNAAGAGNVNWVWCPTGYGFGQGRAQAFYPGDNEVDWVCSDSYSFSISQPLSSAAGPFLSWASHHHKPVIIGEFAVDGSPGQWATWLAAAGQLARQNPQIKALAYFDGNGFDSQGRPFAYWLGSNRPALSEFTRLLAEPFFSPAIPVH